MFAKLKSPGAAMKNNWNQFAVKENFVTPSFLKKVAAGAAISCSLIISSCGDSDLPQLQRDAIVAAQQRALAAQEGNGGTSDTTDDNNEAEVVEQPVTEEPTVAVPVEEPPEETTPEPATQPTDPVDLGEANPVESEPRNQIDLAGFQLVFNDNFDSGEINAEKWNTALRWGPDITVNNEEQYYVDIQNNPEFGFNPFRIDTDSIAISAQLTPTELLDSANNQPYLSGVLTTSDKFTFDQGVAEIRAKIPAGMGLWPQFWMLPDEFVGLRPQLFVMEARGDNTAEIFHSYKYQDENDHVQTTGVLTSVGDDFSADFHTFAVEWAPGELIFYIDGFEFQRVASENIVSQDMYIILNLAIGGWFPGSPDATTTLPAEFVIDHVRVFQKIP